MGKALAGQPAEVKRLTRETPDGKPSRPRGAAFTSAGKYAAITDAPKGGPNTGVVWLVNLDTYQVAGRVTRVGNESYLMGAFRGIKVRRATCRPCLRVKSISSPGITCASRYEKNSVDCFR